MLTYIIFLLSESFFEHFLQIRSASDKFSHFFVCLSNSLFPFTLEDSFTGCKITGFGVFFSQHLRYSTPGTCLVLQWLKICLPMQGTQVESLVGEIRSHMLWGDEVCAPQLLSLCTLEPMFQNKRSLCASTKILYNAMKIQHRKKK